MNIIIGNAWPYANGPLHLGRIAVLMPGDILARYHRLMGDEVVFISGSDSHGNLVANKAIEEGMTPEDTCEKYHEEFVRCFKKLGFSFDMFTKTHTHYHMEKVQEFFKYLYEKGYIYEKEIEVNYHDADVSMSNKKTVNKCNNEKTKHLFFALSKFENDVKRVFIKQHGWRENAQAITKRYLDEGLRDRAVTRDFYWGVDVPIKGYEDKKIYVWIEAVMGYLTASMKCLEQRNEDYMDYWNGEDSRIYLVHGKDNIPFHTVIFPGILAGLGIKNPHIREISSEYLKLEGKQFSTTKNWAIWVDHIIDNYCADEVRYYLMLKGPELKDSDFMWRDFINTVNNDLVGLYGNLVNRTVMFIEKNFNGEIPKGKISPKLKKEMFNLYFEVGDKIEEGRFKSALQDINKMIKKANSYFSDEKPWQTINTDIDKCKKSLYVTIQFIANFSNLLEPFMPFSSEKIRKALGIEKPIWSYIEQKEGNIKKLDVLFKKIDNKNIDIEVERIKKNEKIKNKAFL